MNVSGKRIVVTGGSGSLGSAVVRRALAAGARVAAIDHADTPAPGVDLGAAECIGGVDLADQAQAQTALAQAARALGGLDGLVNLAGTFRSETVAAGTPETFDLLYRVNLRTAVCASKAALAHLRAGGRIVNVGAASALKAGAGVAAYTASKAGVMRFTEALAAELKPRDITVNAVLPSVIDTPPNRAAMANADYDTWVKPEQLADVILFLLSDAASAVTGALLPVVGRT